MYDTNAYSTRVIDPNEDINASIRRSNRKIPYDDLDPYKTPKIVELDENNNVIFPPDSIRSKKRSRSRNQDNLFLQEVSPPFQPSAPQAMYPTQQPYPYPVQQPYAQPSAILVQDQLGNTRLVSSQTLSPSAVVFNQQQPFILQQSAVPILIQQQQVPVQKKSSMLKHMSMNRKTYPSYDSRSTLINDDLDDPFNTITVNKFQRKRSDYIFCCNFYGTSNTDTCRYCWNWCGCPMWLTFVLAGAFVLAVAVLVTIIVLFKFAIIS